MTVAARSTPQILTSSGEPQRPLLRFLAEHGQASPEAYGGEAYSATRLLVGAVRRRKLGLKRVPPNFHIINNGAHVLGGFSDHLTSLVSDQAAGAAYSIPTVRELMDRAELPIPEGRAFFPHAKESALAWFTALGAAAVVKPAYSVAGAGITRDVRCNDGFLAAWDSAVTEGDRADRADPSVVVERQHPGFDLRIFVIGEGVVAAAARVPLFCVGDGYRTLRQLIDDAVQHREAHPQLSAYSYDALGHARATGLPLDGLSEPGHPYLLGHHPSARAGGVTVDVTELLDEGLQNLAIDAVWSLPGCTVASVDLLVQGVDTAEGALILDVDSRADFTLHYYPWMGRHRPVAKSLIQHMVASSRL
ncbi:hypothetical protein [Nesterenkonia ebinurensis]|uniref:hypothetical protein n=1 Tax=Nesterenkonia ebinurensis TaxID=2608252 RepID=UPI00123D362B|nr:hypothetical protein [Nesterenkonia ebinurensis]